MVREVRREYAISGSFEGFLGSRLQIFNMNEGERILAGKKMKLGRIGFFDQHGESKSQLRSCC